ncbi:MAG: ribosomal protein S18-alanine N-acetyltransferase [Gemmatimonadales bacterium]
MADPWRIRRARPADAPALVPLERRCFTDPWSGLAFEEMLRFPLTLALVAERDAGIVGYLIGRAVAGEGEILNLAVAPELRRHGLGARLLEAGLELLEQGGARRVWLEVRESNEAAQALYLRRGFTKAGRRPRYYKHPVEDALVFQLALPAPA